MTEKRRTLPDRRAAAADLGTRSATSTPGGTLPRPQPLPPRWLAAVLAWLVVAPAVAMFTEVATADDDLRRRAQAIEARIDGFPARAVDELAALNVATDLGRAPERDFVRALYGRALVAAGRYDEALEFAGRLDAEAASARSEPLAAAALLVRSGVESATGDAGRASALALDAGAFVRDPIDSFLPFWAEMSIGIAARTRGRLKDSLDSLQRALTLAQETDDPSRRSGALYQLSVVYLALKQPERALEASLAAFDAAEAAGNAFAMANARMAESAVREVLGETKRELAAMEEALAIARHARSKTAESKALINLADIQLRRQNFGAALALSRQALALAKETGDAGFAATSTANLGFALFGLGRTQEGKRHAEAAIAHFEARGAAAEIATLLAEYGQYLERAGDFAGAVALYRRERKLNDEIAQAAYRKTVLEMQKTYESERQIREIDLLSRENDLKTAELANRELQQRIGWLVALGLATSFFVVAALYRKLRATNRLLADRNVELSFQSSRDPLTTLYNRRYFQDYIGDNASPAERRRSGTDGGTVQALLLIDIDHFKSINDHHGHAAGDAVLVTVARRLQAALRETDMIVRWGGEEFLVFVPATEPENLDSIANRVMDTICAEPIVHQGKSIRITASVGYAPVPLPPGGVTLSWERTIGLVDMALYMAKVHGRNRAYGILRLGRCDDATLANLEHDLEGAWHDGIVDLRSLRGPPVPVTGGTGPGEAPRVLH